MQLGDFDVGKEAGAERSDVLKVLFNLAINRRWQELCAASLRDHHPWSDEQAFYLEALFALAPNLKSISITLPAKPARVPFEHALPENFCLFSTLATEVLKSKLKSLTISCLPTWAPWDAYSLHLCGLTHVVRLCVPLLTLVDPSGEPYELSHVMPPALECLEISECAKHTERALEALVDLRSDAGLARLRKVDLSFKMSIREGLLLIDQGHGLGYTLCEHVAQLLKTGLRVGYFDTIHTCASAELSAELNAWLHLSDMEAWYAATKGEQFSATVAHTENGQLRRRSSVEISSLLSREFILLEPYRANRFTPQVQLPDISELEFGTETPNIENEAKCRPNAEIWKEIYAHYNITASIMAPCSVAPVADYMPSASGSPAGNSFVHETHSRCALTASVAKFSSKDWAGVDFFSSLKAPPRRRELHKRRFKERYGSRSGSSMRLSRRRRMM